MLPDEERLRNIYKKYIDVICPYVMQYELLSNTFPIEIFNEIRAVFSHLSKYYLSGDVSIKGKNLQKAEGHIKRSILDCYKYICMAYEDRYAGFERMYKRVDLSLVDNGEFLPTLLETRRNAVALMKRARKSDFLIGSDEEIKQNEAYEKYEEAFKAYSAVNDFIANSYKKIENVRKKALFKGYLAISGYVIGVIGTALTIISFVL